MEMIMSIEGKAKEAAGYIKEELNENGDSLEAKRKAQEGRDLRNEGRIEDGKAAEARYTRQRQLRDSSHPWETGERFGGFFFFAFDPLGRDA
jgi:hypothetical protein